MLFHIAMSARSLYLIPMRFQVALAVLERYCPFCQVVDILELFGIFLIIQ